MAADLKRWSYEGNFVKDKPHGNGTYISRWSSFNIHICHIFQKRKKEEKIFRKSEKKMTHNVGVRRLSTSTESKKSDLKCTSVRNFIHSTTVSCWHHRIFAEISLNFRWKYSGGWKDGQRHGKGTSTWCGMNFEGEIFSQIFKFRVENSREIILQSVHCIFA